jgi:hypothetical protein
MKLTGAFTLNNCKIQNEVAGPPAPVASDFSTTANPGEATPIYLFPHITGIYSSTSILNGPSNGTATIMSNTITFTSTFDFSGEVVIEYEATGPGGSSHANASIVVFGLS